MKELRRCRNGAWKVIRKRRHQVLKVYVADIAARDLLLLGELEIELQSGQPINSHFAARLVLNDAEGGGPKLQLYQAFVVSSLVALQRTDFSHLASNVLCRILHF